MRHPDFPRRSVRYRQRRLAFVERALRRERWFKRAIVLATSSLILAIVTMVPWGLQLSTSIDEWGGRFFRQSAGLARTRAAIDESWRTYRQLGIERTLPRVRRFYDDSEPPCRRLLLYAGMDPDHGLLRWGNYNWTLLLSSRVFEADETGRSYRLRPLTRSIWLRGFPVPNGFPAFFLVPDGPGLVDAIRGTDAVPLPTSRQTTNSWGLRGPEPDLDAPLRGLILGDSYMQGMFIGDDETPPECLRRYLRGRLNVRVSILNTGVMGYSPEQYYHSLTAFADRFRPGFVVVSICANDFGDLADATSRGVGDWQEGKYWLKRIIHTCLARRAPCLIVPVPVEMNLLERRNSAYYPGILANMLEVESLMFLDPMEDFLNAHLKSWNLEARRGRRPAGSTLFNDVIGDGHFSAAGSEVWAESVGRRVLLLLERERLAAEPEESVVDGTAD